MSTMTWFSFKITHSLCQCGEPLPNPSEIHSTLHPFFMSSRYIKVGWLCENESIEEKNISLKVQDLAEVHCMVAIFLPG